MDSAGAFVAGITALALALAEGRSDEELETMAAAFSQLGDTLATICVRRGGPLDE